MSEDDAAIAVSPRGTVEFCCPLCGSRTSAVVPKYNHAYGVAVWLDSSINIGPLMGKILNILGKVYPGHISQDDLISLVYGRHEPEAPEQAIRTIVSLLRKRLKMIGWTVIGRNRVGYRLQRDAPLLPDQKYEKWRNV